ncbi:MAG TPA: biotin--[acetyl-CoA-carboxylase] ligase [Solirubrobacterales bacterium]|jgi:BirA family biotin operon repressor/biotin-[acetyl-CoA-carboxylase] ligase|nr:biotin--[acetyl-CoA-carboxylase] ligase [Solirubrobacterales bacterium]
MAFGSPHRHFRVTDSTNARARELVEAGAPGGTVVTAEEQTAGRGRQGRTWTAPPGKALLYSAVLRPLDERHLLLPLAVPLAVCEAAETLQPGIECAIKWPNDVWVEGRKLAGVLIEAKPQDGWAVIGVGLNLAVERNEFPPELRETATSLTAHACSVEGHMSPKGSTRGAEKARRVLDRALGRWVAARPEKTLAAWRSRDALRGREIAWDGGSGVADGIEDSGDLVVVAAGGDRVVLGAGEVHLRL